MPLVAVLLWAAGAVALSLRAQSKLSRADERLSGLFDAAVIDLDAEVVHAELVVAGRDLQAARDDLGHPILLPLRPVPVIGRQLASVRALAASTSVAVDGAVPVLERVLEVRSAGDDPARRSQVLSQLEVELAALDARLEGVDLGPDEALVRPLADARAEVATRIRDLQAEVDAGLEVVGGLQALFDGSEYLVFGANNAEMENAGGMYLSVGEATFAHGDFIASEFENTHRFFPLEPVPLVDGDIADRWGFLDPTEDFRRLSISPRFRDYVAPQALAMWRAETGRSPTGVLVLDPLALAAIVDVIGAVEIDGTSYSADSLFQYILEDQYEQFGATDFEVQGERRDVLGEIARATVAELGEGSWNPLDLIRALKPMGAGRHILAYSEDPAQQAMWERLGIAGAITGDEVLVNVANLGGSKLDPFLDLRVDVVPSAGAVPGGPRRLTLDVTVANRATPEVSEFAAGPIEKVGVEEPGTYSGRLVVYGPSGSGMELLDPAAVLEAYGSEGELVVLATRFVLPPGRSTTFQIDLVLPDGTESVTVLPAARARPVKWTWDGDRWQDATPRTITLSAG